MSRGTTNRVREVGDSSLVLEIGSVAVDSLRLDADVSRRATAIARAVTRRALPGVRDVVPSFRSVVVSFDPLVTDVSAVAELLRTDLDPEAGADGRIHEVPVAYGGSNGPDLEAVAAFANCSAESVVERHASQTYRVFMLGFMPGFAYMGSVDEVIAAPRRATPRLKVPAGSVGIAGRQTGVYPLDAPGGWQIIGRTGVTLFDPQREIPSLFAPGDQVRFIPVSADEVAHVSPGFAQPATSPDLGVSRHVTVLRPGLLTTVQDTGRWGYQSLGVAVAGSMDPVAHRLANIAVGNRPEAATLEVTWLGPELRLEQDTVLAVAGGDLRPVLGDVKMPLQTPVLARAGSVLRFGERSSGARAYVAFDGGIAVAPVLGSRSTHLRSHLGGLEGRALKPDDRLPLGASVPAAHRVRTVVLAPHATGVKLRVLPGPQAECFAPSALHALQGSRYTVSADSDRMGYRLVGGTPVESSVAGQMVSDVTFPGGLQIPPSGDPILLMADRPTTGGYPQIGVVISADLSAAAQLAAGDWVEFEICSRADAIAALVAQEGKILAAAR